MIQSIHIQNFKSIENQIFDFKPLTILTGTNSSGKSSVIQAILLYTYKANNHYILDDYLSNFGKSSDWIYVHSKSKSFSITPTMTNNKKKTKLIFDKTKDILYFDTTNRKINLTDIERTKDFPIFEKEIYYISANRIGQENQSKCRATIKCGMNGEYIFGFYESCKNETLTNEHLLSKTIANTLNFQVSFWLYRILGLNLNVTTQVIDNANVKISYKNFDLDSVNGTEMSPFNLGAGVSYLTKILILGLSLKEGDILIVENPEVHLHPKAISKFADFFVFLANGGIQVILETHSEHIINKMRYSVFGGKISKDNIQIYYRERFDMPFESIQINERGKYINENNEIIEFPTGFFDSDLDKLLEMM